MNLDNISNMRPATVRTPSRQLRDSSQSIKTVYSPNSPYVGQSSDKPVSAKICLLGCTFLITGYHERAESEYVHKWRVVIERHGGQISDTLTDQVCTICCFVCKSVSMDIWKIGLLNSRCMLQSHRMSLEKQKSH